jgi:primosomal protein N' (replication factor Y)
MALLSDEMRRRSRDLRRNQTDVERILWRYLKGRQVNGWRFRRQHPIPPYIADFACIEAKLIVEADGGQHAESQRDAVRDRRLQGEGWRILRFWNVDILKNMSGVIETIMAELGPCPGVGMKTEEMEECGTGN